jgi:hypothetical protein
MTEINVGASEINTTLTHMTRVTQETYQHVGQLHESVSGFRVEELDLADAVHPDLSVQADTDQSDGDTAEEADTP